MPRLHSKLLVGAAFFGLLGATYAQGPSAAIPPRELEWLNSQVGVWNTAQTFRIRPDAPVFDSTSTESIRWSESHDFLLAEQRGLTVAGLASRIVVVSWSPADRRIHVVEVQIGGSTVEETVSFEDGVAKLIGHRRLEGRDGRLVRTERTVERVSPDEGRFRVECTDQEKQWTCIEGVSKRAK